uniref:Uncharacterized protein n=1 Tax=Tetranychus urticae TaxID=32264 RepID=T1KDY7_TETUR
MKYFEDLKLFIVNIIALIVIFLIETTVSVRLFKQNRLAHHKVYHQVFPVIQVPDFGKLYTVYVAGKKTTIKVPANVEDDQYKIVNWKVMNTDSARLLYISDGSAYIMIGYFDAIKKKLTFPHANIGSIIVLGNNEAIHIPTIVNPNSVQTNITWNYFELLYFDEMEETIKIIEKIPWLDQDDWKYILEWKMLDHITIGTKMYILLKRKLKRFIGSQIEPVNELFIIRLSLNVSDRFLESAVELNIRESIDIYQAQFVIAFNASEKERYSVIIQGKHEAGHDISYRNFMPKLEASFDAVVTSCKETNVCNQMHQHLRSNSFVCNSNCPFGEQLYPTGTLKLLYKKFASIPFNATFRTYNAGYADVYYNFVYFSENQFWSCVFKTLTSVSCSQKVEFAGQHTVDPILDVFSGKTFYYNGSGSAKTLSSIDPYPCARFANCADCIMYGFTFECKWTDMKCLYKPSLVYNRKHIINNCLTIVSFSPDNLQEAVNILKIEFEGASPKLDNGLEKISIFAGPDNGCVNIKIDGKNLTCELNLLTSGNFTLNLTLYNDAYLDSTAITAISSKTIVIEANVNLGFTLVTLLSTLVILSIGIFVVAISVICLVITNITYLRTTILHRLDETTKTFRSRLTNYVRSTLDSEGSSFRSKTLKKLTLDRSRKKDPIITK